MTPTPHEATRRLTRFTVEVECRRQPPLIASPPRQRAVTKRPLPIRSKRIAAQPLSHIPTSKRGEVLLMQRMGIALPAAPVSSASKGAYDTIFTGNLTSSQVEALDELFPVANTRTGRKLFSDAGGGPRSQQPRRPAS
jgi:hypothetical protein